MKASVYKYLSFTLLNIIFFVLLHILHFRFIGYDQVLVAVTIDAILAPFLTSILYYVIYKKYLLVIFVSYNTSVLLMLIYGILVPTMVDRSITVDLLLRLERVPENLMILDDLSNDLFKESVLKKRYTEQVRNGNIVIQNNNVRLTTKGKLVSKLFLYNRNVLKIEMVK